MADFENRRNNLWKRQDQIRRWDLSETNKESQVERDLTRSRIRFQAGCVFLATCSSGNIDEVAILLREGSDINTTNVDGLTALHQACIDENFEMVQFLVEHNADINIQDNEGWTPLHATASCCFLQIARFLIEKGARLDLVSSDGELPIDIVLDLETDDPETKNQMIDLLSKAMDKEGIDGDIARRLEENMMLDDANLWLNGQSYAGEIHPKTGASPLHVAAAKGYNEVITVLLKAGLNINALDVDGWTPLHAAAHWGQEQACRILAENMCDMSIKNFAGETALDVADEEVHGLLEELQEKQKSSLFTNIYRPGANTKARKSSISRTSFGQKLDITRKRAEEERSQFDKIALVTEDDERKSSDDIEDESGPAEVGHELDEPFENSAKESKETEAQNRINSRFSPEIPLIDEGEGEDVDETTPSSLPPAVTPATKENIARPKEQSDEIPAGVMMRRSLRESTRLKEEPPDLSKIGSDLNRRSDNPASWRYAYRNPSNSDNNHEPLPKQDEETSKQSILRRDNANPKESGQPTSRPALSCFNPTIAANDKEPDKKRKCLSLIEENETVKREGPGGSSLGDQTKRPFTSSLLRPETAAALASIANSHQRVFEMPKRDDANEVERKARARKARESRRSTQGVTIEDIHRAEAALQAANTERTAASDQKYSDVPTTKVETTTPADLNPREQKPRKVEATVGDSNVSGQNQTYKRETTTPDTLTIYRKAQIRDQTRDPGILIGSAVDSTSNHDIGYFRNLRNSASTAGAVSPIITTAATSTLMTPSTSSGVAVVSNPVVSRTSSYQSRYMQKKEEEGSKKKEDSTKEELKGMGDPPAPVNKEENEDLLQRSAASRARRRRESRRPTGFVTMETTDSASDQDILDEIEKPATEKTTTEKPATEKPATEIKDDKSHKIDSIRNHVAIPFTSVGSTTQSPATNAYGRQERLPVTCIAVTGCSFSRPSSAYSNIPASEREIDFKKLYEQERTMSDQLRKQVKQLQQDYADSRSDLEAIKVSNSISEISSERRERRTLERKVSELEEELKSIESLKIDNQRLKDENAALIRVISKLSR